MSIDSEFVLQGKKVLLNLFTESDINDSYISWLNDPDVVRFSNQRFVTHNRESSLRYLASFVDTDNLFLSIRRSSDLRQVGTMTAYVSRHHGTVDVGIMIGDKSVWGLGYGRDSWSTLSDCLLKRDDIRKLTAGTLACNYGMIKVMECSDMHYEATRKEQEIVNRQAVDILYYAKFSVA